MPRCCLVLFAAVVPFVCGCERKNPNPSLPLKTAAQPAPPADSAPPDPGAAPKEADEIAVSCLYIDRCLARLAAEPESELLGDRAASIVLSAERTLPVFWGADPESLSRPLRDKVDGYPAAIRGWVDRINEQKSRQILASVKELSKDHMGWREANRTKKWQAFIDRDQQVIGTMQKLVAGMSAGPALDEAGDILLAKQRLLNADGRKQVTAYNKLALSRCHQFINFSLSNTNFGRTEPLVKFDEAEVAKIDAGTLGADARRMYDTALGLLEKKIGDTAYAEAYLKLTETEKWPLSDF